MATETEESDTMYQFIGPSQTTVALSGGAGGNIGDYLKYVIIIPTALASNNGGVSLYDGTEGTTLLFRQSGASFSLSSLAPWTVSIGSKSVNGPWNITTNGSVTVIAVGKFT